MSNISNNDNNNNRSVSVPRSLSKTFRLTKNINNNNTNYYERIDEEDNNVNGIFGQGGSAPNFSALQIQNPLNNSENTAVSLAWRNIHYSTPDGKKLIDGAFGYVGGREIMGILGPSGAGKSTLLSILTGSTLGNLQGEISINGVYNVQQLRDVLGFVWQDNIRSRNLTVSEALEFYTRIKPPLEMLAPNRPLSKQQVQQKIDQIIDSLSLEKVRNNLIERLSGGELKRLSIGTELCSSPKLLIMDEPTSGLSSSDALILMENVKQIAINQSVSVVMTIHQPRQQIFDQFANILLLTDGQVIYFGTPQLVRLYMEQFYMIHESVATADAVIDILTYALSKNSQSGNNFSSEEDTPMIAYISTSSSLAAPLENASIEDMANTCILSCTASVEEQFSKGELQVSVSELRCKNKYRVDLFDRIKLLTWRACLMDYKTISTSFMRILTTLVVATFFRALYGSHLDTYNTVMALAFMTGYLSTLMFPSMENMIIDHDQFKRDFGFSKYDVFGYTFGSSLSQLPTDTLCVLAFVPLMYYGLKLRTDNGHFTYGIIVSFVQVQISGALAQLCASLTRMPGKAFALASTIFLSFLMVMGPTVTPSRIPGFLKPLYYISFARMCWQSFMLNEFEGMPAMCEPISMHQHDTYNSTYHNYTQNNIGNINNGMYNITNNGDNSHVQNYIGNNNNNGNSYTQNSIGNIGNSMQYNNNNNDNSYLDGDNSIYHNYPQNFTSNIINSMYNYNNNSNNSYFDTNNQPQNMNFPVQMCKCRNQDDLVVCSEQGQDLWSGKQVMDTFDVNPAFKWWNVIFMIFVFLVFRSIQCWFLSKSTVSSGDSWKIFKKKFQERYGVSTFRAGYTLLLLFALVMLSTIIIIEVKS